MINALKDSLWKQFGASIDMLNNAIALYPEDYWNTNKKIFYQAYHVLVFLDYYLTIPPPENFSSSLPFTITEPSGMPEHAIDDVVPNRLYSKEELLDYLQLSREKCRSVIAGLTEEKIQERWIEEEGGMNYAVLEILLYNMRHVQHHAAQLNMLLRQELNKATGWVARVEDDVV
ncbi:MAG TPA: DinB family protein [Panacibacter sp.]|nr:DinB family protein [Panacibacter sp.]